MNMLMLAEITSKMDISGVLCLASIAFIFIAILAFSTGPWTGSCICLFFFFIAMLATGDSSESEGPLTHTANKAFIYNLSQTKVMELSKCDINHPDCSYIIIGQDGSGGLQHFIPAEERVIIDGMWGIKDTGKKSHMYEIIEPKWLKDRDWNKPNSLVFGEKYGNWGHPDDYLYKNDAGVIVKLNTGKVPTDDDYYIYNKTFSPANVSVEHGGIGIPQWVYHPASPVWIFGLCGAPALLGGMFLSRKLAGIG